MKFKELENGMAVKFKSGSIGMVYKGFMTYDYILDSGKFELLHIRYDNDKQESNIKEFNIVEVKSVRKYCNDAFLNSPEAMFNAGASVWKYEEPIEELTLEQVCKELGREIKIIK